MHCEGFLVKEARKIPGGATVILPALVRIKFVYYVKMYLDSH
jgi:hypothetical protein